MDRRHWYRNYSNSKRNERPTMMAAYGGHGTPKQGGRATNDANRLKEDGGDQGMMKTAENTTENWTGRTMTMTMTQGTETMMMTAMTQEPTVERTMMMMIQEPTEEQTMMMTTITQEPTEERTMTMTMTMTQAQKLHSLTNP
jgi:hypothetical protein